MKKRRERAPSQSVNPFRDIYGLADLYPIIGNGKQFISSSPLKYGMYFGKGRSPVAMLELKEQRTAEGRILVDAVFDKTMHAEDETNPLTVHSITQAAFQFDRSITAAKSWTLRRAFYSAGKLMPETAVEKRFTADHQSLRVETSGKTRRIGLRTPAVPGWALFLSFETLRKTAEPFRFTLVEDGDSVKEDQKILYARTLDREWNGKPLKLHEFHHTGVGMMPQIYWTNDDGLLLFSWTALTSWVLQ